MAYVAPNKRHTPELVYQNSTLLPGNIGIINGKARPRARYTVAITTKHSRRNGSLKIIPAPDSAYKDQSQRMQTIIDVTMVG